jgi:hypothetical protein
LQRPIQPRGIGDRRAVGDRTQTERQQQQADRQRRFGRRNPGAVTPKMPAHCSRLTCTLDEDEDELLPA